MDTFWILILDSGFRTRDSSFCFLYAAQSSRAALARQVFFLMSGASSRAAPYCAAMRKARGGPASAIPRSSVSDLINRLHESIE